MAALPMYETIFILDSLLAQEEIDNTINRVKELIETNGGKILTIDKWGKRRLAFEIQKKQYGFYVAIEFEGEGPISNSLESEYNFNDKVLRYLTYRYTKNKIKARAIEIEMKEKQSAEIKIQDTETPEKSNTDTPVKEEPVKEEPVKEEPVKEEPVKEEPVKEESVKEEKVDSVAEEVKNA